MEQPKFKWCREVTKQVRFKPDHDKIREELMAHIEDRCEDLKDSGLTSEEAELRAVASMGDPTLVGKQLDAVHKPWLGWLWVVSRWLMVLLAMAALVMVVINWDDLFYESYDGRVSQEEFYHNMLNFVDVEESELQDVWAAGRLEQLDFTVDKIRRTQDGSLMIRFRVQQPWYDLVGRPALICQRLYLQDETGNRWVEQNLNPDGNGKLDEDEYAVWAHAQESRNSWTYILVMIRRENGLCFRS